MTKQFCFLQEMSVTDTSKNLMSKLGLRFLLQVATDYKVSKLRRNGSFCKQTMAEQMGERECCEYEDADEV